MKKVFKTILTICMLFMLVMPVSADEKMINFVSPDGKLIFETNYNENDYYLEINSDDSFIIYTVYDNDDNFKESWSFEKLEYLKTSTFGTRSISTYRHYNTKDIGAFSGKLNHEVVFELYSSGSFSQFNNLKYDIFYVEGWSYYSLGDHASSITPAVNGGWPTTKVQVDYSTVILAILNSNVNLEYSGKLISAGFSAGTNFTYSKLVTNSYTIQTMA